MLYQFDQPATITIVIGFRQCAIYPASLQAEPSGQGYCSVTFQVMDKVSSV